MALRVTRGAPLSVPHARHQRMSSCRANANKGSSQVRQAVQCRDAILYGADMDNFAPLFARLSRSAFRSRFRLNPKEETYLAQRGLETILSHAGDFIAERLAPALPLNDGKQTPMRGHPVFVAQHATATCCRSCLSKWHDIAVGQKLSDKEQAYIVAVIRHWLSNRQR